MNKQCSGWTLNNFKRETYKVGPEKTWTPTLILKLTWNWISVTNCGLKNCEVNLANSSIVQVHCNICPNFKFTIFLHQSFHPKSALLGIWLYIMMDTWQAQDISSRSNIHPPTLIQMFTSEDRCTDFATQWVASLQCGRSIVPNDCANSANDKWLEIAWWWWTEESRFVIIFSSECLPNCSNYHTDDNHIFTTTLRNIIAVEINKHLDS